MSPHVAVLLTGMFRTLDKILPFLHKNLLSINNCCLFVLCKSDSPEKVKELLNSYDLKLGALLIHPIENDIHCKAITEMILTSDRPALSKEVQDRNGGKNFTQYLRNSGSISQYYQFWKLWQEVIRYERQNNCSFTHCVRTRTDILFNKPLIISDDLSLSNPWYEQYKKENKIITGMNKNYSYIPDSLPSKESTNDYIITFYLDFVWIGKRKTFDKINSIVFHYGLWDNGYAHTFNAESTLNQFCINNNIKHYAICENSLLKIKDVNNLGNSIVMILRSL